MTAPKKTKRRWHKLGLKRHPKRPHDCRRRGCRARGAERFHHFWFCHAHTPREAK